MTQQKRESGPWEAEVLSLLPTPLYTGQGIYFEDDLEEAGLTHALGQQPFEIAQMIVESARTLASIKPELAFHFLRHAADLLDVIGPAKLGEWVQACLQIYDTEGLNPARAFILTHNDHPAFQYQPNGVAFEKVSGILQNFLCGLDHGDIRLETSAESYTDGLSIFVPEAISVFQDPNWNFLLYKVSITHKIAQLQLGTYRLNGLEIPSSHPRPAKPSETQPGFLSSLSHFFHRFPEPQLARDLFTLADALRAESWIRHHLPGLFRRLVVLKKKLGVRRNGPIDPRTKTGRMNALIQWYLSGCPISDDHRDLKMIVGAAQAMTLNTQAIAQITAEAYACLCVGTEPYGPVEPILYVGVLKPEAAEAGLRRRRESRRLDFQRELAKLVGDLPDPEDIRVEVPECPAEPVASDGRAHRQEIPDYLIINDGMVPVPECMHKIIQEIYEDLGSIPSAYLTVADDMTGHYFHSRCQAPEGTGYFLSEHAEGIHVFDEWDHRRQGYRKRWALLRESDAEAGELAFVDQTMARFGAMAHQIKRRFECVRQEQILLRRQNPFRAGICQAQPAGAGYCHRLSHRCERFDQWVDQRDGADGAAHFERGHESD